MKKTQPDETLKLDIIYTCFIVNIWRKKYMNIEKFKIDLNLIAFNLHNTSGPPL